MTTDRLAFFASGYLFTVPERAYALGTRGPEIPDGPEYDGVRALWWTDGPAHPEVRALWDACSTPVPLGHLYVRSTFASPGDPDGFFEWIEGFRPPWFVRDEDNHTLRRVKGAPFEQVTPILTGDLIPVDRLALAESVAKATKARAGVRVPRGNSPNRREVEKVKFLAGLVQIGKAGAQCQYITKALKHLGKGEILRSDGGLRDPIVMVREDRKRAAIIMGVAR
jgi:hypothetical protein